MCFKKKIIFRFILILFFLIPGIYTDSLLTDDAFGITHYDMYSFAHADDTNVNSNLQKTSENIDDEGYKLFSVCVTDTFTPSETFQINQFINRSQEQSGKFRFSLFLVSFFLLSGYSFFNSECLHISIRHLKKLIIIYIHKSDGKKRLAI